MSLMSCTVKSLPLNWFGFNNSPLKIISKLTIFLRNQFERKWGQCLHWTGDEYLVSKWVWGPWPWVLRREIYSDYSCECARVHWPRLRRWLEKEEGTNIITTLERAATAIWIQCKAVQECVSFKLDAKSLKSFSYSGSSYSVLVHDNSLAMITPELLCQCLPSVLCQLCCC